MKTYFVDTSALLKCYVPEEGSEWMDGLLDEGVRIVISSLSRVEVVSNLQRLLSVDKLIDRSQFLATWASFSLDLAQGRFEVVGMRPEIVDGAVRLLTRVYITPVDSLQIATAMSLGEDVVVVSSDRKMNKTLAALGIAFVDPTGQPSAT